MSIPLTFAVIFMAFYAILTGVKALYGISTGALLLHGFRSPNAKPCPVFREWAENPERIHSMEEVRALINHKLICRSCNEALQKALKPPRHYSPGVYEAFKHLDASAVKFLKLTGFKPPLKPVANAEFHISLCDRCNRKVAG